MRARPLLTAVLFLLVAHAAKLRGAEDLLNNPAHRYHNRYYTLVNSTLMRELPPHLVKRFDLLDPGSLHMTFRVNRDGKTSNVKVTATGRNQFAQETALRVIRSLKLPPIPKDVILEDGHPWLDASIDLAIPAVKYTR